MNLSCLFGHSFVKIEEGFLLVLNKSTGGNYRYDVFSAKLNKCKCCKKTTFKRQERLERSDTYSQLRLKYENNVKNNLVVKVIENKEIRRFIEDFNKHHETQFKEKDFIYV